MAEMLIGTVGPLLTIAGVSGYFAIRKDRWWAGYFMLMAIFVMLARINSTLLHAL